MARKFLSSSISRAENSLFRTSNTLLNLFACSMSNVFSSCVMLNYISSCQIVKRVTSRALAIFIIVLKLGWQVFVTHLETVVWSRCNSSANHLLVSCFSASITFILFSCLLINRHLFNFRVQSYNIISKKQHKQSLNLGKYSNFIANNTILGA